MIENERQYLTTQIWIYTFKKTLLDLEADLEKLQDFSEIYRNAIISQIADLEMEVAQYEAKLKGVEIIPTPSAAYYDGRRVGNCQRLAGARSTPQAGPVCKYTDLASIADWHQGIADSLRGTYACAKLEEI